MATAQAQFTITDLNDGVSYYTYIRYADDINGTNMSESPGGKTYIGVYSGTSSTAPNSANDYIWSKYVGESGAQGVSVTSVIPIYYLKVDNNPPSLSNGTIIDNTSTGADQWTTAVPTYVDDGIYYISYQTFLSSGTSPVFSNVVIDYGLTSANSNATAAVSNASAAISAANSAIQYSWPLYCRSSSSVFPDITANTTIYSIDNENDKWSTVMLKPTKDDHFYACTKQIFGNGTVDFIDKHEISGATYAPQWCASADSVFIDGGAIYAGSVTASQIAANTLTLTQISTDAQSEILNSTAIAAAGSYTDAQMSFLQVGGVNLIRFSETPAANNTTLPSSDDGGYVPGSEGSDISDSPISIDYIDSLFEEVIGSEVYGPISDNQIDDLFDGPAGSDFMGLISSSQINDLFEE